MDHQVVYMKILYQDEHIVAVDKPAGLLVHRSRIDVHAREFAVQKLRNQIDKPVFLVHRLDRPTSGVLLFALSADDARQLSEQFQDRRVSKTYRAIVRGYTSDLGRTAEPLIERHDRVSDTQAQSIKTPQAALTTYETIRRWELPFSVGKYPHSRYSEVKIVPVTGRKHQIRRHFNHLAHPIIGDTTHGDRRHNRLFREQLHVSRLLLMAEELRFTHPASQQVLTIQSSRNADFEFATIQLDRFAITNNVA